ncbi:hypothetical protein VCHA40O235_20176 [Vibrio chagasii]|nr:hypothetical protein VCHA40O235_20176 [Vibrio chagasii]
MNGNFLRRLDLLVKCLYSPKIDRIAAQSWAFISILNIEKEQINNK